MSNLEERVTQSVGQVGVLLVTKAGTNRES